METNIMYTLENEQKKKRNKIEKEEQKYEFVRIYCERDFHLVIGTNSKCCFIIKINRPKAHNSRFQNNEQKHRNDLTDEIDVFVDV